MVPPFADSGSGDGDRPGDGKRTVAAACGDLAVAWTGAIVDSVDTACNFTSKTAGTDARLDSGGFFVSYMLVNP